ncbi:uncharacterized protein TNCV_4607621 [Trichonephila clavipes]|nr:uncharacterized protein TNCV_4607621 [Trichonephila clavipes]
MSLPNPVEHKSHDVINNKLSRVMKEVAEESMKMAAVKEYSSSPDNLLTVSGDGTWKTRGHSSFIGKNYSGSAGKMEVDGMLRIFNRSEKLHNLKYSNYIGDGDTKTFNALSENKPYGDDYLIQKIECVGYVQKRMGTRLRKLILVYSKKKLSDGKTIGGKGRLTDSLIDKLAHYYGNAIRCNSTSVKEMRKAIWAVFGVILAALMMNRCTGFVLQIQIHGIAEIAANLETSVFNDGNQILITILEKFGLKINRNVCVPLAERDNRRIFTSRQRLTVLQDRDLLHLRRTVRQNRGCTVLQLTQICNQGSFQQILARTMRKEFHRVGMHSRGLVRWEYHDIGMFFWQGGGALVFFEGKQLAMRYIAIVTDQVHPTLLHFYPIGDVYFMDHNVTIYYARSVQHKKDTSESTLLFRIIYKI